MKSFFDIYEEIRPKEVLVENKESEDKLFNIEEKKETVTLPEGFEENLINRISQAVINQINQSTKADTSAGGEGETV